MLINYFDKSELKEVSYSLKYIDIILQEPIKIKSFEVNKQFREQLFKLVPFSKHPNLDHVYIA